MNRSATTELDLEAGHYLVMIKITASRDKARTTPEEIVKKTCQARPEKLMAVGLSYDIAHGKGHLKDSELERKERLRRERRDKRRIKAKKAFEAQKMVEKKEKLRRLRLEAKEKAKRGGEPQGNQDTDNGIKIYIKMGESTLNPTKAQDADKPLGGSKMVSQEGTSKELKIIVQASDKIEDVKNGDQTTSGEIKQPAESEDKQAEDSKQALKKTTDEIGKAGSTSAPSTENGRATEDCNTAEGQLSAESDENAVTDEQATDTEATTQAAGNAINSKAVEPDLHVQTLTLDDISDDGLGWSSDIDVPSDSSSSSSSSSSDSDTEEPARPRTGPSDEATDEFAQDPWNAVCVFGLRVYAKGSHAEIGVVRKEGDDDDDDGAGSGESKKLDVDDQAADATKKLQKGSRAEEQRLESVGTAPAWDEESKQG